MLDNGRCVSARRRRTISGRLSMCLGPPERPGPPLSAHICAAVRVRRLPDARNEVPAWSIDNTCVYDPQHGDYWNFNHVFGPDAETAEVYDVCARSVVRSFCEGINGTILAYGQTSSGKTYTMYGDGAQDGIVQSSVSEIFDLVGSGQRDHCLTFSFLEIYNEHVLDLLSDSSKHEVKLLNDETGQLRITPLTEEPVRSLADVKRFLHVGMGNRHMSATRMNRQSSRSHVVVQINLELHLGECVRRSQLNLVDLAGSEGQRNTEVSGDRQREAKNINRSLLALTQVVKSLSTETQQSRHNINIRSSKLTRILERSLGGNAQTLIICTMAPTMSNHSEIRNTLDFGSNAKRVENRIQLNESRKIEDLAEERLQLLMRQSDLQAQNEQLKEQAAMLEKEQNRRTSLPRINRRHTLGSTSPCEMPSVERKRVHATRRFSSDEAQSDRPRKRLFCSPSGSGVSENDIHACLMSDVVDAAPASQDNAYATHDSVSSTAHVESQLDVPDSSAECHELECRLREEWGYVAALQDRTVSAEERLSKFLAQNSKSPPTIGVVPPSPCESLTLQTPGLDTLVFDDEAAWELKENAQASAVCDDDEQEEILQLEACADKFLEIAELLRRWEPTVEREAADVSPVAMSATSELHGLDALVLEDERDEAQGIFGEPTRELDGLDTLVLEDERAEAQQIASDSTKVPQVLLDSAPWRDMLGRRVAEELSHVKAETASIQHRMKLSDIKVATDRLFLQRLQRDAENRKLEARLRDLAAHQDEEKDLLTDKSELRALARQELVTTADEARAKVECLEKELAAIQRAHRLRSMKLSSSDLAFFKAPPSACNAPNHATTAAPLTESSSIG